MVSVIIPTYNRLPLLRAALDSVYSQTYRRFEVLVVDDASSDGTERWLRAHPRPGLRLLRHRHNRGPAAARNTALGRCRGGLIAMLDSDDAWRPGYLRAMVDAFGDRATQVCFSDYDIFDDARRLLIQGAIRAHPVRHPIFAAFTGIDRVPILSGVVFRRGLFRRIGTFDESFRQLCDDGDILLRAGIAFGPGAFRFVDRRLVAYRQSGSEPQQTRIYNLRTPEVLDEMRARWPKLDAVQRQVFFDVLYQGIKHRWWLDLMLER